MMAMGLFRFVWILAALSLAAPGCKRDDAANTTPATTDSASTTAASRPVAAVYKLTAEQFTQEYGKDKDAAERKYKAAVIEISGTVKEVQTDSSGRPRVQLEGGAGSDGVYCYTKDQEPWAQAARGQKVTLRGRWPEFMMVPGIEDCDFAETGPATAIGLTSEQLADEYAKDYAATAAKYKGKDLIVTGAVVENRTPASVGASLVLKGNDKVKVLCDFGIMSRENHTLAEMSVGRTIKVFGPLLEFNNAPDVARIATARPISK